MKNDSAFRLESVRSDYLVWLKFAVPGMLHESNIDAIAHAIRHLPDASPIVEIGSFCGLSTCVLAFFKEKHGAANPMFTADKWCFEGQDLTAMLGDSLSVTQGEYKEFVRESFIRNLRRFSPRDLPHTIEADSDEFFAAWSGRRKLLDVFGREAPLGGPVSFAYIDGNHSYGFANRDFENCDRYLVRGGFVLFDDSADGSEWEVCRVVQEVAASGRYELVSKNPNYMFRKK